MSSPYTNICPKKNTIIIERTGELEQFSNFISNMNHHLKILHIYGTGGIGKSLLMSEFKKIATRNGLIFIKVDTNDFYPTPKGFMEQLLQTMEPNVTPTNVNIHHCLQSLASLATEQKVILAIDTYEKMKKLDRWFRQIFLRYIHPNILIVTAGRKSLNEDWIASPAWRSIVKQIHLHTFNIQQTTEFLNFYGIENESTIDILWQFTRGHPLTLSIASLTKEENEPIKNIPNILNALTNRWLLEVNCDEQKELIIAAAILKNFDQSSLSTILGQEIKEEQFNELTNLSFVNETMNGWAFHELISDAIKIDLKNNNLEKFEMYRERCATYYYNQTIQTRNVYDISQFFYHLGTDIIQSIFFQDTMDTSLFFEPVGEYNFHELEEIFARNKQSITQSEAKFYNRRKNKSFTFHASLAHNIKEAKLINSNYVKKLGYDVAQLLKDKNGKIRGFSIIVPINVDTVEHLISEPVSSTYFANLSKDELNEYTLPKGQTAGWFIRLLDYTDPSDTIARSFSLYNLFPLLLSGGRIIVSTPLPFFKELLTNFGFEIVPNATHYDYGIDIPSPTYILDVRGPRLAQYLKQFLNQAKEKQLESTLETYSFSNREKAIIKKILAQKTNAEIASELYIAEVTVKKHITRIFTKAEVKNRRQLIKKILRE